MARLNLSRHWKFRRLARAVNSTALARGLLELLWESAYEAASEYIGSPLDIADAAGWTGEPVELVAILLDAELLDERAPGEYVIHDLWDHVPPYVKLRWTRANPGSTPPWHRDDEAKNEAKGPPIANERTHPCGDRAQDDRRSRTCTGRVGSGKKKEQRRQTATRSLRSDEKNEKTTNVRVLVRLAYELGERYETEADLADALKTIAARYRVPYDGASIGRALELLAHARAPLWSHAPQARRRTA